MIKTIWLSTLIIKIDGLTFNRDCYGTDIESILLIDCKSYKGITKIIESWSCNYNI